MDDAEELAQLARSLSPLEKAGADFYVGQWLRRAGDVERAAQMYVRSVESYTDPANRNGFFAFVCRGRCHSAIRDFESAISFLREALESQAKSDTKDAWATLWMDFEMAILMEQKAGPCQASRERFGQFASNIQKSSKRLWGLGTPALLVIAAEKAQVAESESTAIDQAVQDLRQELPTSPLDRSLSFAALGLVEERLGNVANAIDYFVQATESRPGTFEQISVEWINDHMVKLMTEAGQLDRLERLLREDIGRRDSQLSAIHPERAFVRIRLVQFLVDNDRVRSDAEELLAQAKEVYDYHGQFLPDAERQKLDDLQQEVTRRLASEKQLRDDGSHSHSEVNPERRRPCRRRVAADRLRRVAAIGPAATGKEAPDRAFRRPSSFTKPTFASWVRPTSTGIVPATSLARLPRRCVGS